MPTVTEGSRILVLGWWSSWVLIVMRFPLFFFPLCVTMKLLGKYRFILSVFSFASFPPQSPYTGIPRIVAFYLMVLLRYCFFRTLKFCASALMPFFQYYLLILCLGVPFGNSYGCHSFSLLYLLWGCVISDLCYYCWNCLGQTLPITWWT